MTTGPEDEGRPVEPTFADVMNGFSFDSGRSAKRRRWGRRREAEPEDTGQTEEATADNSGGPERWAGEQPVTDVEPVAGRYPPYNADPVPAEFGEPAARDHQSASPPWERQLGSKHSDGSPLEPEIRTSTAVRPYAWTRGRTRSGMDLQIETLVSTSSRGRDDLAMLPFEHRSVAELCERAQSVAEVAALLAVPLGVAKVLLGDMAGLGLVVVHQSGGSNGDVPDLALMERVLSGLRRL